ncbi:MAG TPA: BON domain-containing protein [Candidatus Angelobacter sp.]|nr:BON domain-containing protein [Candidatus Angelobacter sp.]
MKKLFLSLGIGFSLALAAIAQSSSQTQTPPVNPTTPANQIGSGAQSKSGTPAPSSTTSPTGQVNPTGTAQPPDQTTTPPAPATGGVAGAAGSSIAQSPSPDTSAAGIAAVSDTELQSQIQNALNKEPTLTGDSTHVTVTPEAIELAGNVGTSKEKITATRIVQSYAGSKKVMNHLTIGGKGSPSTQPQENPETNHPGSTTPATNPDKGGQPPLR